MLHSKVHKKKAVPKPRIYHETLYTTEQIHTQIWLLNPLWTEARSCSHLAGLRQQIPGNLLGEPRGPCWNVRVYLADLFARAHSRPCQPLLLQKWLCQVFNPVPWGVRAWAGGEVWEIGVAHHMEPRVAVGLLGCSKWVKKSKVYYGFSVTDILVPILQWLCFQHSVYRHLVVLKQGQALTINGVKQLCSAFQHGEVFTHSLYIFKILWLLGPN